MMRLAQVVLVMSFALAGNTFADYAKEQTKPDMANWERNTTPGENHTLLKDLAGKWNYTSKWWMDPNAKPEESKGTQTNKLILGGRFLESDHTGKAMGKPFNGKGLLGYDLVRGEYQSMWVDNMSTSIMTSAGSFDPATRTINETGSHSCPMTGEKNKWFRAEWKLHDKKHYSYFMYSKDPSGKEYRTLELDYKKN